MSRDPADRAVTAPQRESLAAWRYRCTRCRANSAHIRQSRPDFGFGFQVKDRNPFEVLPVCSEEMQEKGWVVTFHVLPP